jgi:hypothetical protein
MAGRIRKLIGVLLLITAVLVTQMPGSESRAASTSDFQMDNDTLVKYVGTASSVSIPANVKKIGAEAFSGNTTLTAVSIGSGVKEIEYGAFKDCPYLTTVVLPDTLETLGNSVFSNDVSLKSISFKDNLKNLGTGVFAGCKQLTTISVSEGNPYFVFADNALYNKDKTVLYYYAAGATAKSYTMPSTVEKISQYAFWGNDVLTQVTLSTALGEISDYAFSNCQQLTGISIPYSVKSIDAKAFENCSLLYQVEIPVSVSYIHDTAFDGCPYLHIVADEGTTAYNYYENWKLTHTVEEPGENTEGSTVVDSDGKVYTVGAGGELSSSDKSSTSVSSNSTVGSALHDPSNVDYIPETDPIAEAEEGVLGKTVVVSQNAVVMIDPQAQTVSNLESRAVTQEEEDEASQSFVDDEKGGALPKYAIVDDRITAYAYYGTGDMTSYQIPSNIQTIGEFAFARSGLESITIPDGVKEIGYAAFYHCDNLDSISIPSSVTWIAPSAFAYSGWLTNWANNSDSDDFLVVGDGILLAYKGNASAVEVPDGVKTIAPDCFLGHEEIQTVTLPDSVKIIGEEAFMNCTALETVEGADALEEIQDRAFANTGLTLITIPETVKDIGIGAFYCNGDRERRVVFAGLTLPSISYTDSTSRISNGEGKKSVFNGNWTAFVANHDVDRAGTVLDDNGKGFVGSIAEANGTEEGLVFTTIGAASSAENGITVTTDREEWQDKVSASLDYSGAYHLTITGQDSSKIADGYQRIYGDNMPQMVVFDMTLSDDTDTVYYTRFGSKPLEVSVPLPSEINGNTIHVVALDKDGQLENLSASLEEEEGTTYVKFTTTHLSTFAIYALGEGGTLEIQDGEATYTSVSSRKDYSPNTGDFSIEPKWFIALAMAAIAAALILYRPRRVKNIR